MKQSKHSKNTRLITREEFHLCTVLIRILGGGGGGGGEKKKEEGEKTESGREEGIERR